jgi:hypothetical protein
MYGAYVKKRGWIKCTEGFFNSDVKCCRNAGDMHDEFIFKNKWALNKVLKKYPKAFEDLEYEYKEIPEEALIDKRVVPSSKKYHGRIKPFKVEPPNPSRMNYHNYCDWCSLRIDSREAQMNGICVHCLNAFHDKIMEYYDDIDEEVKLSWQRAKILDEI